MTPLERAALAIVEHIDNQPEPDAADVSTHNHEYIYVEQGLSPVALARSIVAAIREPSEGMLSAANALLSDVVLWGDADGAAPLSEYSDTSIAIWQAMIDALLAEG